MESLLRQTRGIFILITVQAGLYFLLFSEFKPVDYTFLWAAIYVFAFLLKLFNLGGDSEANALGRGSANSIKLALASTVFQKQKRPQVSTPKDDRYDLVNLGLLAFINAVAVYVLG